MLSEGYRKHPDHRPKMLIESQEEGIFRVHSSNLQINKWYDVGTVIGEVDDHDEGDPSEEEWLWQAYSHEPEEEEGKDRRNTSNME